MNRAGAVATPSARAYRPVMASRLLRLLILLAMVVMPVRMATAAHVPAAPTRAGVHDVAASPCGEHEAPGGGEKKADLKFECMMACAALPGNGQSVERLSIPVHPQRPGLTRPVTGRNHGADPPPPRFS